MKAILEQEDIAVIVEAVVERLKPLLQAQGSSEADTIFNIRELAEYLYVTPKWLYDQTRANAIPYLKLGQQLRFRKTAIDKWLQTLQAPAVKDPASKDKLTTSVSRKLQVK